MSLLFSVKRGARLPSIVLTLASSATYDLVTAASVNFVYRSKGSAARVVVPLTVVDATAKTVRLDLAATDVAVADKFQCQVEVTIGGKVMCFPQTGFDEFAVTETI